MKKNYKLIIFALIIIGPFFLLNADPLIKNVKASTPQKIKENPVDPQNLLKDLFTDLIAFRSEYGFLTTDLVELAFLPKVNYTYACGFKNPSVNAGQAPSGMRVDPSRSVSNEQSYMTAIANKLHVNVKYLGEATRNDFPDTGIKGSSFLAACVSKVGGKLDVWTIDEKKNIKHLSKYN